ncbi:MAG: heat-inducible transcriptional repressor HrcA [Pseudomonadales bacterium]|nr:heat-inducible transcriptional repressor HrcA [Pseudomonadales bacterium]
MGRTSQADQRVAEVLRVLVEKYIEDGQPVGSKMIAQALSTPVSAATVRNVMALLEDRGLIVSPHTSAGRVPTELGYRMFVDGLIKMAPIAEAAADQLREKLHPEKTSAELVEAASQVLSDLTSMACVVIAPTAGKSTLKHIEFLPLDGNRVLVVLVMNEDEVQNRIVQVDREYSKAELQQASNFINQQFIGRDLKQIRDDLLVQLKDHREQLDNLMQTTIDLASKALKPEDRAPNYVVSGQSNLLYIADEKGGVDRLKQLFDSFQEKRDLLGLMDRCIHADGVQIFIGQESGYQLFDDCSLIASPYKSTQSELLGMLAVIGPTRMPYQQVVPAVDMTAKILGAALKSTS